MRTPRLQRVVQRLLFMQIARAGGVEALAHAGELEASRDDHDRQQRQREPVQQTREALAEQEAQQQLEHAEEHDAGAGPRPEAELRR